MKKNDLKTDTFDIMKTITVVILNRPGPNVIKKLSVIY
jgi:hypothetical protein